MPCPRVFNPAGNHSLAVAPGRPYGRARRKECQGHEARQRMRQIIPEDHQGTAHLISGSHQVLEEVLQSVSDMKPRRNNLPSTTFTRDALIGKCWKAGFFSRALISNLISEIANFHSITRLRDFLQQLLRVRCLPALHPTP